jgi:hypothetical protein
LNYLLERKGYDRLWDWFGLSYASWLTLPRVLMHEMPDDWQARMAELLQEWDETWDGNDMPSPYVSARKGNKFTKWPGWLLNYRHPDGEEIERVRSNAGNEGPGKAQL